MRELSLGQAVDRAIEDAMARDDSIVLMGEDVPMLRAPLFARFGADRVLADPDQRGRLFRRRGRRCDGRVCGRSSSSTWWISSPSRFDAVLNHMAKLEGISAAARWTAPLVIRAPTGAPDTATAANTARHCGGVWPRSPVSVWSSPRLLPTPTV